MTDPSLEDADVRDNTVTKWRWSLLEWLDRRYRSDED